MALKEVKIDNNWVELHSPDIKEDVEYLVMPPLMAYFPLMVWANANGHSVLTDDPWEYEMPSRTPNRPTEYPENLSVARVWMLGLDEDKGTRNFTVHHESGEMPSLHEPNDDVLWETVHGIRVHYDIIRGNGATWVAKVSPDIFIYEDRDDTYHVFAIGQNALTRTYPLLNGAIEAFALPAMRDQGSLSNQYNDEWYQDYRLTTLHIHVAAATKRFDLAAQMAMNHFGLPIATAKNLFERFRYKPHQLKPNKKILSHYEI